MIIEIPFLILVCIGLWKTLYVSGREPLNIKSATSNLTFLCSCIQLIWMFVWYPYVNLRIDVHFLLFSIIFLCVVFYFYRKVSVALNLYFLVVTITYIILKYFIFFNDKSQALLFVVALEIGVPLFWIMIFILRKKMVSRKR